MVFISIFLTLIVLLLRFFILPQAKSLHKDNEKPLVIVSFSVLKNLTEEITQDTLRVVSIVGPQQDPHLYQSVPKDLKNVSKASLFFINGLGLEGWARGIIDSADYKNPIIELGAACMDKARIMHTTSQGDHVYDPHLWHDVSCAMRYVEIMTKELCKAFPHHALLYQKSSKSFMAQLKALDTWCLDQFSTIDTPRVITTHDAFYYFGKRYGISFYAPLGVSTEAQASAKDVAHIIELIKTYDIRAVFVETLSNPHLIQQIVKEIPGANVDGTLYADALSKPGEGADTYIKMIKHNATHILKGMRS
jgi:zinc/manganese transport system substrate-binding protein